MRSSQAPPSELRAKPIKVQGYRYHLENTPITHNFSDDELQYMAREKPEITRVLTAL